jgi:hypothetical protein
MVDLLRIETLHLCLLLLLQVIDVAQCLEQILFGYIAEINATLSIRLVPLLDRAWIDICFPWFVPKGTVFTDEVKSDPALRNQLMWSSHHGIYHTKF